MNAETKHSGPVDVLVVLDASIAAAEHHEKLASLKECPGHVCIAYASHTKLREARAAVAELIEFKRMAMQEFEYLQYRRDFKNEDRERWTALAKIGSAS